MRLICTVLAIQCFVLLNVRLEIYPDPDMRLESLFRVRSLDLAPILD